MLGFLSSQERRGVSDNTDRHTSDNQNVAYQKIKMNRNELIVSGLKCRKILDFCQGDNIPAVPSLGEKAFKITH